MKSKTSWMLAMPVFCTALLCSFGSINFALASESMHSHKAKPTSSKKRAKLDEQTKSRLLKVFEANNNLHSKFFKYNAKEVEEKARKLNEAIGQVSNAEILKLLKFSQKKLSEITASSSRDLNNKNYNLVSMALIHVLNKYDLGSRYNAYSCPMVKKKWIQNSQTMAKVHNPYAPEMPHCGSKDSQF